VVSDNPSGDGSRETAHDRTPLRVLRHCGNGLKDHGESKHIFQVTDHDLFLAMNREILSGQTKPIQEIKTNDVILFPDHILLIGI
jgi:hypothetical protein